MTNKGVRFLGSLLLVGAMAAPLALTAQDRDDRKDQDRDHHTHHQQMDRDRKADHQWNENQDRAYRQWYSQKHKKNQFRDYDELSRKDQQSYWSWQKKHGGDRDDRHDRDDRR